MDLHTYTVGHLFAGCGGGADGFARAHFGHKGMRGRFRTLWGVDQDPAALLAFERLSGGLGVQMDLFSEEDYRAFHGGPPPTDWREVQPEDFRRELGPVAPDVLFTSPPCVGLSRLISASKAGSGKYQAVNRLTLRGIMLALAAWSQPPKIILLENVPGLGQARGKRLLDQIEAELKSAGYSVAPVVHDLGVIGGLGQRRARMMLAARHRAQVPPHLFEPAPLGLRSVGEVLGELPMPEDPRGGPMHQLGRYQWLTWLRLALIPAGRDWRALRDLRVVDGYLADLALTPDTAWHGGALGVTEWGDSMATITGRNGPTNGAFGVADPRVAASGDYGQLGVTPWGDSMGAVTAQSLPGGGRYSVADPRAGGVRHNNAYRVIQWGEPSQAITAGTAPSSGGLAVADPRPAWDRYKGVLKVEPWEETSRTVIAQGGPGEGGLVVADPRARWMREGRSGWDGTGGQGAFGVTDWESPSKTVTASGAVQNGPVAVADPRLPQSAERGLWVIVSLDGTWHRPITRLEAAALQGFRPTDMGCRPGAVDSAGVWREAAGPNRMALEGSSATRWQRWIGNAVPPPAACRIAEVVGRVLLQADAGESFVLDAAPVWARPLATGLSMETS
ncbi:MAG: DNA cytosine methyltransferase [Acidobacteriota bacterium]